MGYGDFKLLAALGAWLGWRMLLPIVLLAALVGALAGIALIVAAGTSAACRFRSARSWLPPAGSRCCGGRS